MAIIILRYRYNITTRMYVTAQEVPYNNSARREGGREGDNNNYPGMLINIIEIY